MKVKICGITRYEDAALAVELGAWAVGFVFYSKSPRAISPSEAKAIIERLPARVKTVGVFVNESVEEMLRIQKESGIQTFQLHGDESPEVASQLPSVFKAIRPRHESEMASLRKFSNASYFLVDAYDADAYGGTGNRASTHLALAAKAYGPLILAGGLNSDNVADAIRQIVPDAIDVSSGVEERPGVKDRAKLQKLFEVVGSTLA